MHQISKSPFWHENENFIFIKNKYKYKQNGQLRSILKLKNLVEASNSVISLSHSKYTIKGIKLWNPIMPFLIHFSLQMYPKLVNLNKIIFYLSNEKVMFNYMCHLYLSFPRLTTSLLFLISISFIFPIHLHGCEKQINMCLFMYTSCTSKQFDSVPLLNLSSYHFPLHMMKDLT
jgi:hypothetical protein